jgi:hypothetical protein
MDRNNNSFSVFHGFPFKISILLLIGWMIFTISWILLYASSFSLFVHLGVSILSLLIFISAIAAVFLFWMKRFIPQIGWDFLKTMNLFKIIIITILIPFTILILLSMYLIFFADSFSFLQNISMLIIAFLLIVISIVILWKKSRMSPLQFVKQSANPFNQFQQDNYWK